MLSRLPHGKVFVLLLIVLGVVTHIYLYLKNTQGDNATIPRNTTFQQQMHKASRGSSWTQYTNLHTSLAIGSPKTITSLRTQPNMSGIYRVPENVVIVTGNGSLLDRISQYNAVIGDLRNKTMEDGNDLIQQGSHGMSIVNVFGNSEEYLSLLSGISGVVTVLLSWIDKSGIDKDGKWSSTVDSANILIHDYYDWAGSQQLCRHLQNAGFTRHRWNTVLNSQCSVNISHSFNPKSMNLFSLNALQINEKYFWPKKGTSWPSHFYTDIPRYVTYLHRIQTGIVNELGEVYTGRYRIVPYNCKPNFKNHTLPHNTNTIPLYNEVFSISQFWGSAFFHKNLEEFPKLAPYLEFLKQHTMVKIHAFDTGGYTSSIIRMLGIDPSRLISGTVRATLVYLPRGTSCGFAHVQETQLFSSYIRPSINEHEMDSPKNLILIRRSKRRFFGEHAEIADGLKYLAKEFGLRFYLFRDDPVPSLDDTKREFRRAKMVVAPHGAGLSNLVFAEPGTIVLEGLCEPPHTNMCYTRLAHLLGMRYYGFLSRGGCEGHVNVPADEIVAAAREYLQRLRTDENEQ